jgi:NAD(P)-dependent dehydrogenase (short-subunit alcohol dehydrogenase family)
MKVILVGASGKIGRGVDKAVSANHQVVRVGLADGDVQCDYTNTESVRSMFATVGAYDALVSAVGDDSRFLPFEELVDDDFRYGFERKFLSQIRLMTLGQPTIQDGGSFTLTSGFLSHYSYRRGIATGPFNAALETFVEHTARFWPRGIRINVVSPGPVVEPGLEGRGTVTSEQCAEVYVQAIEGTMSGQVLRVWGGLPIPKSREAAIYSRRIRAAISNRRTPETQQGNKRTGERRMGD